MRLILFCCEMCALLSHFFISHFPLFFQFVPFANYFGAIRSANSKLSPQQQSQVQAALAKAVLEEIPYQVTSFCKMHKIQPLNMVAKP